MRISGRHSTCQKFSSNWEDIDADFSETHPCFDCLLLPCCSDRLFPSTKGDKESPVTKQGI